MYEKYATMSLEVATLICRKHQRTIQKEYASHFWRLQIRMGFAEKYTWHTVGDPTLAQKIGSYSELVLGSFFGAQGSTSIRRRLAGLIQKQMKFGTGWVE